MWSQNPGEGAANHGHSARDADCSLPTIRFSPVLSSGQPSQKPEDEGAR